jgi:hypothetical protein
LVVGGLWKVQAIRDLFTLYPTNHFSERLEMCPRVRTRDRDEYYLSGRQ